MWKARAFALATLIGMIAWFVWPKETTTEQAETTQQAFISVEAKTIESTTVTPVHTRVGEVVYDLRETVTIQSTNRIQKVEIEQNQRVQAGQTLVELVKDTEEQNLRAASLALRNAENAYERAKSLYESNTISKAERNAREADFQSALVQTKQAQTALDNTTVKASIDGIFTGTTPVVGQTHQIGSSIGNIINLEHPTLVVTLNIDTTRKLIPENTAQTEDNTMWSLKSVGSQTRNATQSVDIRLTTKETQDWVHGQRMTTQLFETERHAITIEEEHLAFDEEGNPGIMTLVSPTHDNPCRQSETFCTTQWVGGEIIFIDDTINITNIENDVVIVHRGAGLVKSGQQVEVFWP